MALCTSRSRTIPLSVALAVGATLLATAGTASAVSGTASAASGTASAASGTVKHGPQRHASGRYLALGDSVSFGYTPPETTTAAQYAKASSFVSYPQDVAGALKLRLTNAACPGETTTSFLTTHGQSNGCETEPDGTPGYRKLHPLHQSYLGTQMAYAVSYLKAHPDTSLVTLMIGANDGFLCEETTADACSSELSTTLTNITNGVTKMLEVLRGKAGYSGEIALVTYYSTDYRDAVGTVLSTVLNEEITIPAAAENVVVVDGFDAFRDAATLHGGDTCAAGLLVKLPDGTCNVHPSPLGHTVLAAAVEAKVKGAVAKELAGRA